MADGSSPLWRSPTTALWHIDAGERGPSTPSGIAICGLGGEAEEILLETIKRVAQKGTGWRPDDRRNLVRERRSVTLRFKDGGFIPNHIEMAADHLHGRRSPTVGSGPSGRVERLSDRHGWGSSWRDSIYDYAHYHSSIHEVLGIARGSGRVRAPSQGAGGVAAIGNTERYVSIRQRAKNSRRIPTGMAELEAVLAALRKKCQEGISRPASAAKSGGN
jgi:hypothetical protein